MTEERRFAWRITCEVEAVDWAPFASRTVEISGSLMAPVEDAPEFGITAARKALVAAGDYAREFPPDGTPVANLGFGKRPPIASDRPAHGGYPDEGKL